MTSPVRSTWAKVCALHPLNSFPWRLKAGGKPSVDSAFWLGCLRSGVLVGILWEEDGARPTFLWLGTRSLPFPQVPLSPP